MPADSLSFTTLPLCSQNWATPAGLFKRDSRSWTTLPLCSSNWATPAGLCQRDSSSWTTTAVLLKLGNPCWTMPADFP
ncbi:hypothetical protein DPMN_091932 [Dreissena polymorpha]|uniref:Uncharacterized protein n=1 Tax=Dreissena polymorpha TaxID=45954 RepID=A0A9D4L1F2_DREPO|nr:hypothetical protein DPMN_091932 [Dreissena polymorpha]